MLSITLKPNGEGQNGISQFKLRRIRSSKIKTTSHIKILCLSLDQVAIVPDLDLGHLMIIQDFSQ